MGVDLRPKPKQADGAQIFVPGSRLGSEFITATHNFTDRTTWYSESTRVTDGAMTDSGDGFTFNSPNQFWIDMVHGKVFTEEKKAALVSHGYAIEVKSDGVTMTQREPFADSGGDYTVDYAAGTITFEASQAGKTVTASYSYEDGSGWILAPQNEKALIIEKAEVQFSKDVEMNGAFTMDIYGYADIFAPHLLTTADPPGPLAPGTQIPIDQTLYKSIDQIIDEAIEAFPEIPVMGGSRGYTQPRHVFQFHYSTVRTIYSSLGMYIRIYAPPGAFLGERSTATFYCTSHKDPGPEEAGKLLSS